MTFTNCFNNQQKFTFQTDFIFLIHLGICIECIWCIVGHVQPWSSVQLGSALVIGLACGWTQTDGIQLKIVWMFPLAFWALGETEYCCSGSTSDMSAESIIQCSWKSALQSGILRSGPKSGMKLLSLGLQPNLKN